MNLADVFEYVAAAVPDREAIVAGDKRHTYRELNARTNRLANYWLQLGIKPGDTIGILSKNRMEWVEAMIAAFKVRAVPININFRYVANELDYLFKDADLKALVVEQDYLPLLSDITQINHYLVLDNGLQADGKLPNTEDYEQAIAGCPDRLDIGPRSSDDIYMLYTGGTTGFPKGTIWRQEDIFYAALKGGNPQGEPIKELSDFEALLPNAEFVSFSPAPMMHGGGQWTALNVLLSGGRYIMYCEPSFDAEKVWQLVSTECCNSLLIVGDAMGRPLAETLAKKDYDLSSLFVLSSGGAVLSAEVKAQLHQQLPNVFFVDGHGSTETGHNGTVMGDTGDKGPVRFELAESSAVLNEQLEPVAVGETGMLARCGHIPLRYHNDPEKTAATFVTDAKGTRWVLTGDYMLLHAEGQAELLGRGSACINSGGEKIYAEEVDSVITNHPSIADAAVVGTPCERFGQKVTAVVQLREGETLSLEALNDYAIKQLARYKLPRALVLVDTLPRTPAAKPNYGEIKAIALQAL